MMVSCGVFFGVLEPNAAIELGQNSLSTFPSLAASRQLNKESILMC